MSLFDIPASEIDAQALESFLHERLPESWNLDYKRQLSEGVYETIAAMANTYGGIVLIGVEEDANDPTRPLIPPVGVDPSDRERLVNQAYTRFQPPFALEVHPVPLPGSRVVLVVRIDPARAERPLVLARKDDYKIPIRLEARKASADRYRMATLFNEPTGVSAATLEPTNSSPGIVNPPFTPRWETALAARVAVEALIPTHQIDRAVVDTEDRRHLADAMKRSPLTRWLEDIPARWELRLHTSAWKLSEEQYRNLSSLATLRWSGQLEQDLALPWSGQAVIQLPAGAHSPFGRLTLLVDAVFDPQPLLAAVNSRDVRVPTRLRLRFREHLDVEDLYRLLLALVETSLDIVVPAVFPRILDLRVWNTVGPVAYLHAHQKNPGQDKGLGDYLNVKAYQGASPPNLGLPAATFTVPRTSRFDSHDERAKTIKNWLARLLLDMGLQGFEEDLAAL